MHALALMIVFIAIIVLVVLANWMKVAYPIVLVLGGIVIGYIRTFRPCRSRPNWCC